MSRPLFTPEDRGRAERKLSDGINQAIRDNFGPLTAEEKRRLAIAADAPHPLPADPIDELVSDLRRIEAEHSHHSRKL